MAVPVGPSAGGVAENPTALPDADKNSPRMRTTVVRVGIVAIAVKLLIAAKDLAIARSFGTSSDLDLFLLAFALTQFAMTVVAGSFSSAFVPTYVDVREQRGRSEAVNLFAGSFADGLRVLFGSAAALAIAGPLLLLALVPSRAGAELAIQLFFLLLPTLLLNGVSVAWASVLAAEERYTVSVLPQLLAPIVPLAAVLAMTGGAPDPRWLAVSTTVGFLFEMIATGWLLRRIGIPIRPKRLPTDPYRKKVVAQFLPVAAGSCMMASTLLIDQTMSVRLGPGSVAELNFGSKSAAFITSAGALALSTAALPHFAKIAATEERSQLVSALKHWVRIILAVTVPVTVALIVFSRPITQIVFQRGAFTAADTDSVSRVQQMFLLQVPAYLIGIVIVRVISALKANVVLLWGAALNLLVNVGLNLVLGGWFGVAGIALSTSAVYWVSTGFLTLMLVRRLPTGEADER